MSTLFELMDACAAVAERKDESGVPLLLEALEHANWRVRYAAVVALGDMKLASTRDAVLAAAKREDAEPLFTQPELVGGGPAGATKVEEIEFPEGTDERTKEAWSRRGRLLSAMCLALGAIGDPTPAVVAFLHDCALDQARDYTVRAAACKALSMFALPESLPVLEKASGDEEWCTNHEAAKGILRIKERN